MLVDAPIGDIVRLMRRLVKHRLASDRLVDTCARLDVGIEWAAHQSVTKKVNREEDENEAL